MRLQFCVEEELEQDKVVLIFDDGNGDGNEIAVEDEFDDLGHLEAVGGS